MTEPALLLVSLAIVFALLAAGFWLKGDLDADRFMQQCIVLGVLIGMCLAFFVSSVLVYSWPDSAVNAMDCAPWVDLKEGL